MKIKNVFLSVVLSMIFSYLPASQAAETIKIFGGPGAVAALNARKAEIEKAAGHPLEMRVQAAEAAFVALIKGHIEGVANSVSVEELMKSDIVQAAKPGKESDYQLVKYGETPIYMVLHPENPAEKLSKEQIIEILSGKLKTWKTINGRDDEIKIVMNKTQSATIREVPRYFLGKNEIPGATVVTNVQGVINNLKENRGLISFSGSKFDEPGMKPKFIETELKINYTMLTKKPPSAVMEKILAVITTGK